MVYSSEWQNNFFDGMSKMLQTMTGRKLEPMEHVKDGEIVDGNVIKRNFDRLNKAFEDKEVNPNFFCNYCKTYGEPSQWIAKKDNESIENLCTSCANKLRLEYSYDVRSLIINLDLKKEVAT